MEQTSIGPARKVIVRVTIGSFSLAALMGIIALLAGGQFGETEGRILMTTLLVGVLSVAVLCYLATSGGRYQWVGIAGGVVIVAPAVAALLMIWNGSGPGEGVIKVFGVGSIVAATLAQASLLLALGQRARPTVRRLRLATLVLAAALAVMTSLLVLGADPGEDWYYRVLGVVAILDVLGTVLVAALKKFGASSEPDALELSLPEPLAARLHEAAVRSGRSRGDLAIEAIERYLAAP